MAHTIKPPRDHSKLTIYKGMIEWLSPDCDRATGEIYKNATVINGDIWNWRQFDLIVKSVSNRTCDVSQIMQNCKAISSPKLPVFTIEVIWSGFLCDVISGGGLSEEQATELFGTLVCSTAKAFGVTKKDALFVDLRDATQCQIAMIDHAFSKKTCVNYVSYVLNAIEKNPKEKFYARDVLSRIYACMV